MGYKLPERTVLVKFEGSDYEGAEVRLSLKVKMGMYLEVQKLRESGDANGLFQFIGSIVKDWNLEDDDGPLPPSYEGVLRLDDAGFINTLVEAWTKAATEVAAPLGQG